MEKKLYIFPQTRIVCTDVDANLLDASIPKGDDGPNIPESKERNEDWEELESSSADVQYGNLW